uniref:Centrosomal protein 72 n=1 Tax=Seriola lalandi dorsalis TaxID=1841481 RepID=A0A3B4YAX0_SERLL
MHSAERKIFFPTVPEGSKSSKSMAAECLTTITEQWIRDRLQLKHPSLADVRSLSLPGTYEEKIRHLGNALTNFVRLKSLDLSCNALVSVEGVQHLKMLERLILYYNSIPSLEEVKVLYELLALRELDLRLNPLTKNDPNYRPYLVHAMPNLRKLGEIQLFHPDCAPFRQVLGIKCPPLTSPNKPDMQPRDISPPILVGAEVCTQKDPMSEVIHICKYQISLSWYVVECVFSTLFSDQSHHHNSSFINIRPPSPHRPGLNLSDSSNPILHPPRLTYSSFNKTGGGSSLYRKPLEMLLNLVDKHWTGEKSLHHNNNFLSQAVQILSMMENDISSREAEVRNLRREADALSFQAAAREEEHKTEVRNLSAQLEETRSGKLNEQLRIVLEENVALQKQLIKLERQYLKSMMKSSPITQIKGGCKCQSLVATNECLLAELKGSGEH